MVLDLKDDLPGAEWILCNTVTTYQSFFNSLTNEKRVSNKKIVTMHSSIIIFAFHSLQRLSVLSLRMFRTFLQSLLNGAMFLTFELPKRTFSCCDGCRIYQRKFADRDNWQFYIILSCSAEVITETSSCCLQCHRVQFVVKNRTTMEICCWND